jgi:hypothetical protein
MTAIYASGVIPEHWPSPALPLLKLDSGRVQRAGSWFSVLALTSVLAGCTINDPTENTFAPRIVNDTRSTATIVYCNGISSCKPYFWTETLHAGASTSDNISAGPGDLSVFAVTANDGRCCIRLARQVKSLRLSTATAAACHRPYG